MKKANKALHLHYTFKHFLANQKSEEWSFVNNSLFCKEIFPKASFLESLFCNDSCPVTLKSQKIWHLAKVWL